MNEGSRLLLENDRYWQSCGIYTLNETLNNFEFHRLQNDFYLKSNLH